MKILHFIDVFDFSLGGIVQFVYQQVRALAAEGLSVTLVAGRGPDLPDAWRSPAAKQVPRAIELTGKLGVQGRLQKSQLQQVLELAQSADLVHLHGTWILGNVQIAAKLAPSNKPVVVSTHGMLDDWSLGHKPLKKKIFLHLFGKRYLRQATRIHCTAEAEKQQVVKNIGFEPSISVIPPVIELPPWEIDQPHVPFLDSVPGLKKDVPRILFLSRLLPNKGPDILLEALALVKQKRQAFHGVMVGPGEPAYVQELRQQAQRLGLESDVSWLGMQREPNKSNCYREADLYVLPTVQENFGIVLVEAMAMGLPVITTRGTDVWRELGDRGAIVSERTPAAISMAILNALSSLPLLKQKALDSAQRVREWLNPTQVALAFIEMYQESVRDAQQRNHK